MNLNRLTTISKKEFSDQITSRRFLLILIIFCLVLGISAINGVNDYNKALDKYKEGATGQIFQPSVLIVFQKITNSIGLYGLGAVIGIATGFDLISREREGQTIKTILSQPLFRDELINGKAIAGILALATITLAGFLIVLSVMLIIGIVPDPEEFILIGIIWLITLLLMISSFTLALMSSVFAKTSSSALILALIITFLMYSIIPVAGGEFGSLILLGKAPQESDYLSESSGDNGNYENIIREYNKNQDEIYDFVNLFSSESVYNEITTPITWPSHYIIHTQIGSGTFARNPELADNIEKPTIWSILKDKWVKILVFIMWPAVFFGVAYIQFMRADLR